MAREIFRLTVEIEKDGGLKTFNGERRRTPGGVFFRVLHNSDNISAETKVCLVEYRNLFFSSISAGDLHVQSKLFVSSSTSGRNRNGLICVQFVYEVTTLRVTNHRLHNRCSHLNCCVFSQ